MCFEKKYNCKNKSILFKKNFFLMKKITPTKLKNKNINSISIYKNIMFNLIKKTTIFLISSNKECKNIKFSKIFSLLFLTIFKIIFLKKNNLKLMMNFKKRL